MTALSPTGTFVWMDIIFKTITSLVFICVFLLIQIHSILSVLLIQQTVGLIADVKNRKNSFRPPAAYESRRNDEKWVKNFNLERVYPCSCQFPHYARMHRDKCLGFIKLEAFSEMTAAARGLSPSAPKGLKSDKCLSNCPCMSYFQKCVSIDGINATVLLLVAAELQTLAVIV